VLLLSWEDDNLGVLNEIDELDDVFRRIYHFEVERWKIPSKRSHNTLAAKLLAFLDEYESKETLLIVYYGGHGSMNDDRQCVWSWYVYLYIHLALAPYMSPSLWRPEFSVTCVSRIMLSHLRVSDTQF